MGTVRNHGVVAAGSSVGPGFHHLGGGHLVGPQGDNLMLLPVDLFRRLIRPPRCRLPFPSTTQMRTSFSSQTARSFHEVLTVGRRHLVCDLAAVTTGLFGAMGFSKILHSGRASVRFPHKKSHEYPAPSSAQAFVAIKITYLIIVSRVSCPEMHYFLLETLTDIKEKMFGIVCLTFPQTYVSIDYQTVMITIQ